MLQPGNIVQERYRIVKPLGQGGMGAVYRAWDLRLKVPVALKELRPQPGLDAEMLSALREQFEQEASILARLNHPNLVRVTDFFEEDGNAYLVMDFVEGRTLADIIIAEGAQPESKVIAWANQLLGALIYCHSQGVIHRDIKPQNIVVKADGRAVLVDFGLVKLWDPDDPRTRTAMRGMGTPEYAPPEQYGVTNDHTGPATDLYSLGATLYHALTGQAPPTATERMAMPERFQPLHQLAPHVSRRTEEAIMGALSLQVQARWPSAEAMLSAISSGPLPGTAVMPSTAGTVETPTPVPAAYPRTVVAPQVPPPITPQTPQNDDVYGAAVPPEPAQPVYASQGASPTAPKRKRRLWIPLLIGVLVCGVAACIGAVVGVPLLADLFPTATPESAVTEPVVAPMATATSVATPVATATRSAALASPTPVPEVASGDYEIVVDNQAPYGVCYVYISPTDSNEWGDDWLGSDEIIETGARRTFTVPAGAYDIIARSCDDATMATAWDISGNHTVTTGGPGLVPLWVNNQLDVQVCFLFVSPATSDSWGEDQLGPVEALPASETRILFVPPGTYDMLAQDCDANDLDSQFGVEVQAETQWDVGGGP